MKNSTFKLYASAMLALASLASMSAFAEVSTTEMLVRFKAPQFKSTQSFTSALGGLQTQVDVVDEAAGLVKFRFKNAEEAAAAKVRFEASGAVLHVAPNGLYRPQIKYSFSHVERALRPNFRFQRLDDVTLSASSSSNPANLPEISPAPATVNAGNDVKAAEDWALANIHMPTLADTERLVRSPITAAVVDTGIDYNHEDLSGALWRDATTAEVGFDFAHNHNKPYDVVKFDVQGCLQDWSCALGIDQSKYLVNPGHGTHCAGHVGAVANNSLGIRGIGSNAAKVVGIKFFYDEGDANAGQGDDAAAVKAIDYAIAKGVKVISASWGGRMKPEEAEASELKTALIRAQKAGVLVVVAAGNDSVDQDTIANPGYPARYDLDNLIVVAATDKDDKLASFSSFGVKSVHIGAPGVKILSTTVGNHYDDIVAKYTDPQGGAGELDWDGTSMATPIVAGAVSLLWATHPEWDYHQVRDRILSTSRKVPSLSGKVSTGGILDVKAALGI
jgi:subtilisin family serine protease